MTEIKIAMMEKKIIDYFKNKDKVIAGNLFGSYAAWRKSDISDKDS